MNYVTKVDNTAILNLYLAGRTQTDIATELNLTKATVCRRMKTDSFQKMLKEARAKAFEDTANTMVAMAHDATAVLRDLLHSENEWIRLNSSIKIINLASELYTATDIMQEIQELKESLSE